ncbi:exonuclease [Kosakonia phage Kc304]|nr:exonuclease [Kosakonia phage Kc304]UJJ21998.1 exonuclease A [Erwinia phage Virsaitis27]
MIDFVIDYETFGSTSNAAVIDLALIAFNADPTVVESFDELVARGKRVKFNLASQKGHRVFSKGTIKWWKEQSAEARLNLAPTEHDMTIVDGITEALMYLKAQGIDAWNSQGWCRGMSFDFPIFTDHIREIQRVQGVPEEEIDTFTAEPCKFWNQRDIRTAIECYSMVRGLSTTPLPAGTLNGFVMHDSIHDCAKDILMLKYAQRYALGLDEVPDESNTDPLSLPKSR